MKKKIIGLAGIALGSLLAVQAGDMAESLKSGDLWKKTRQELAANVLSGVKYSPVDEHRFRVPRSGGLTLGDLEFGDAVLSWDGEDHVSNVEIMIYNKGDDGLLGKDEFDELVLKTSDALSALSGGKGKAYKASKKDTGVKIKAWRWEWEGGVAQLEVSSTGKKKDFSAEFIRLKLGGSKEAIDKGGAADAVSRRDLKANVKKEDSSVWIEGVNMVDQGQKGYCVPATVSRVFAYYGMDGVDQHALAQLCNSSGEGGTNTQDMQIALEDISRAFHIRVNVLEGANSLNTLVSDYNKMAQKMKKPLLTGYNVGAMKFDPDVLIATRSSPKQLKKWMEPIRKSVDAGIPVIWSVRLGVFPEPEIPQADGGHMRLIIGYKVEKNEKNKDEYTILYSDSWGAGHELKKMSARQACAMTTGRYILKPSR